MVLDDRHLQPGDVPARSAAVADHDGLGCRSAARRLAALAGIGCLSMSLAFWH